MKITLALLFSVTLAAAATNGLPQHVAFKTHESSYSAENLYALKDGKIWVKPNEKSCNGLLVGKPGDWSLFEGTGLPFGKDAKSFAPDDKIVEISTEALMVVAKSDKGRLYFWDPTLKGEDDRWYDKKGAPLSGELRLPPHKDWAFSMSVQRADYKRKTPMIDANRYYLDHAGNKVEFGYTASIYTLDPDGTVIRFWDTGLPPSFHKGFATPERGRFKAERLTASGSTVFVVDRSGKMYTRPFDYEMFGACPGLYYTFDQLKQANKVLGLFEAKRVLPTPDWAEQKAPVLEGQAELTTNITIAICGEGPSARELRIQGRRADGAYGYYHRLIDEEAWGFEVTDQRYASETIVNAGEPRVLGEVKDKTYDGSLSQKGADDVKVTLVDFDYYDSPATLRVDVGGGKTFDLTLYTFDAWSPSVQAQDNPAIVGSIYGEPKLLVGTLEIPEAILKSSDPQIKAAVDQYFRRFHHVHKAFAISANDAHVEMLTRRVRRNSPEYFDYSFYKRLTLRFDRELPKPELERAKVLSVAALAEAGELKLPSLDTLGKRDLPLVDKVIQDNKTLLKELREGHFKRKITQLKAGLLDSVVYGIVFLPANAVLSLINFPMHNEDVGGVTTSGGGTFKDYAKMNILGFVGKDEDYAAAASTLKNRIEAYRLMRDIIRDR